MQDTNASENSYCCVINGARIRPRKKRAASLYIHRLIFCDSTAERVDYLRECSDHSSDFILTRLTSFISTEWQYLRRREATQSTVAATNQNEAVISVSQPRQTGSLPQAFSLLGASHFRWNHTCSFYHRVRPSIALSGHSLIDVKRRRTWCRLI